MDKVTPDWLYDIGVITVRIIVFAINKLSEKLLLKKIALLIQLTEELETVFFYNAIKTARNILVHRW